MFFFHFPLLPPRDDPPNEPVVEAPPNPLPSDDEDEVEDNQPDEAHYDSFEKASTPPADCWALPQCKPALPSAVELWFNHSINNSAKRELNMTSKWTAQQLTFTVISVLVER